MPHQPMGTSAAANFTLIDPLGLAFANDNTLWVRIVVAPEAAATPGPAPAAAASSASPAPVPSVFYPLPARLRLVRFDV